MVFRFIALVLIVLGLMLLGADVVSLLEHGNEPHMRSLAEVWSLFSVGAPASFESWVAAQSPGAVADGVTTVLGWPAFAVLGVIGVMLAILFREREEELGDPSF